jgi:hypothetical protein
LRLVTLTLRVFSDRLTTGGRSLKDAEDRVQWLEKIVDRELAVDSHHLPTGTPISSRADGGAPPRPTASRNTPPTAAQANICDAGLTQTRQDGLDDSPHAEASNMSILALNATGEQRYLGPSSGSFFASYAAAILRSCAPGQAQIYSEQAGVLTATDTSSAAIAEQLPLQPSMVKLLQRSYEMWINPLYPLMSLHQLSELIARCASTQANHPVVPPETTDTTSEMTIFYLVMALGAMNSARTFSKLPPDMLAEFTIPTATTPCPAILYSLAMQSFRMLSVNLQPSISMIQVLLLVCIYSSQSPFGPSQWQLSGFAMRVGSHAGSFVRHGIV